MPWTSQYPLFRAVNDKDIYVMSIECPIYTSICHGLSMIFQHSCSLSLDIYSGHSELRLGDVPLRQARGDDRVQDHPDRLQDICAGLHFVPGMFRQRWGHVMHHCRAWEILELTMDLFNWEIMGHHLSWMVNDGDIYIYIYYKSNERW